MTDLIFDRQREHALTVACPYCHAEPGQRCADPRTGYQLERQVAHLQRLRTRPDRQETTQ